MLTPPGRAAPHVDSSVTGAKGKVGASAGPGKVSVLGGGSWGTALAALLAGRSGEVVRLWAREPEVVASIRDDGINHRFLPDVKLPAGLAPTTDAEIAVRGATVVVSVVPSQFVRGVLEDVRPHLSDGVQLVSASKGIETSSLLRMDEVFAQVLPASAMARFTVLSGPSFAKEVATQVPTAVVVASHSITARARAQELFQTDQFRVYTNPDVVGVELGGALKNVVAIATGMVAGLGLGYNTQAALITRGLAEITRLGLSQGATAGTFAGLAGMGDLVLTCTGPLSRNRTVGERLGKGESLADVTRDMSAVAEGIETAHAVVELAEQQGVDMPIAREVSAILRGERKPLDAVRNLMVREPRSEDT